MSESTHEGRTLRPARQSQPERPTAPHLLDGPRAVAFNLMLLGDRTTSRTVLWRFLFDRAIDAVGDHYVDSLADLLAAHGLDPRARPGQQQWCVLAQDGRRGAVRVAEGWAEVPARALALAVEEDGLGPYPRFTRWRAVPSTPDQPPLRDVNLWPRRIAKLHDRCGATSLSQDGGSR